jgi:hypothetical protein
MGYALIGVRIHSFIHACASYDKAVKKANMATTMNKVFGVKLQASIPRGGSRKLYSISVYIQCQL